MLRQQDIALDLAHAARSAAELRRDLDRCPVARRSKGEGMGPWGWGWWKPTGKPWKTLGKLGEDGESHGKTMGKPWEKYGKMMKTRGKLWEYRGNLWETPAENYGKMVKYGQNTWGTCRKVMNGEVEAMGTCWPIEHIRDHREDEVSQYDTTWTHDVTSHETFQCGCPHLS